MVGIVRCCTQPPLHLVALAALTLVAGCQEDEKSCYDRINADLTSSFQFGLQSGDLDYAKAATDSGYAALAIYSDDDRSICDYVTAGPYLQRK